ncbi:hypothetical protein [Euzebya tangerina]|uniref:hypothetical protein n=1 Tax=Euzebya tangerina TaxID=591198 RepID=UPI0013C2C640|nr:hypothetical protein [Euzebya tangerina]
MTSGTATDAEVPSLEIGRRSPPVRTAVLGTVAATWTAVALDQPFGLRGTFDRAATADGSLAGAELWAYPLPDVLAGVGAAVALVVVVRRSGISNRWRAAGMGAGAAIGWLGGVIMVTSLAIGLIGAAGVAAGRVVDGAGLVLTAGLAIVLMVGRRRATGGTSVAWSAAFAAVVVVGLGSIGLGHVPALGTVLVVGLWQQLSDAVAP